MSSRVSYDHEAVLEVKNGVVVCSISEIARLLQVDRKTVSKAIINHDIKPSGVRRKHPIYPLAVVARKVINGNFW